MKNIIEYGFMNAFCYILLTLTNILIMIGCFAIVLVYPYKTLLSFISYVEGFYYNQYKTEILPERKRARQRDLSRRKIKFKNLHKKQKLKKQCETCKSMDCAICLD